MSQSVTLYGIVPEQYGTRKAKSVDIQALNTILLYDLIQQKRISATSIFADLVSNYELVVHSITPLSLQRVDVPKYPIICTLTTLQNMSHSVRTAFGDSKYNYGGDTWEVPLKPPPQGMGEGNGSSPAIWAIFSTPLLNCLRKAGHGAAFKCSISGLKTNLVGYCFIDDSKIY